MFNSEGIKVSDLKNACERIENHWGNTNVVVQIMNEDGSFNSEHKLVDIYRKGDGTLVLSNHKFKQGKCL